MSKNKVSYRFKGGGLEGKDRRWAKRRFNKYKKQYHFENMADLSLLEELVFRETIQERNKEKIQEFSKAKKTKNLIPKSLMDALDDNLENILALKERLGFFEETGEDAMSVLNKLKKKAKRWRQENQGSRTLKCPFCKQLIMLKIRTDAWEAQKHPFFKDNILFSEHLVRLYIEKKINKTDVAKVLDVSPDYIEWLVDKMWNTNPKYEDINPTK